MPNQIIVERVFDDGVYTVTISIVPGGTFPENVFLYEYEGEEPSKFFAVCTLETLSRPVYEPGLSTFGVRYVRWGQAIKQFSTLLEAESFESSVVSRINNLGVQLSQDTPYSKVYTIGE